MIYREKKNRSIKKGWREEVSKRKERSEYRAILKSTRRESRPEIKQRKELDKIKDNPQ